MQGRGKLKSLWRDFDTGNVILAFEMSEGITQDTLSHIQSKDLSIEVKPYRERRSLDANAYFHVLCGKLAEAVGISKPRMKNIMMARYGQSEYLSDGVLAVIKTNIPEDEIMELDYLHCSPVRYGDDGTTYYRIIRGTHTYDTKEMSSLIDGVVQEAKDLGIETMTPEQIKRMEAAWQGH